MPKLKLLSVRKAAQEVGINYQLFKQAVSSGQIKTVTLGRRPMIPAEALQAFVEQANLPTQAAQ
jgi:excisionase family DNA binding protein